LCLGADVLRGKNQKPFNDEIEYDYTMWIDSDQVFTPKDFEKLLNHNKDIVSGLYMMADMKHFACVKDWDVDYFRKHGTFKFLTPEDLKDKKNLIEVSYNGFGWMLIKKGVFENLEYPWFKGIDYDLGDGVVDFSSEDASFCKRVIENGYKVFVDPQVIVGHEKTVVL
jgi:GT2 family glycosyltransferase